MQKIVVGMQQNVVGMQQNVSRLHAIFVEVPQNVSQRQKIVVGMQQNVVGMQQSIPTLMHKIVVGMRHGVSATSGDVTRRPGDVRAFQGR